MAETYGFFNSAEDDVRSYSAEDLASALGILVSDGIAGGSQALSASRDGLTVTAGAGGAVIDGYWYKNSTTKTFEVSPPSSGVRYDRIVVRLNRTAGTIKLVYRKGTAQDAPELYDNSTYREIPVCRLVVVPTTVTGITDERSFIRLRGGT